MELFTWHVWTQNTFLCNSQGLHKALCFMSLDKALGDKYSLCCCCSNTTASEVQRFHCWHDLGVMGMTHPSHTPPHPSSMTSIAGYTTSRTESAAGHPRTYPPTGATHTSHSLLARALSHCIQNAAQNNTGIFPGFLSPDRKDGDAQVMVVLMTWLMTR